MHAATPAAATGTLDHAAMRRTTEPVPDASAAKTTALTRPSASSSAGQCAPVRMPAAARSSGMSSAPRWKTTSPVAGSVRRIARPPRSAPIVPRPRATSLAPSGISAQRTATKSVAAASSNMTPVAVTQVAAARRPDGVGIRVSFMPRRSADRRPAPIRISPQTPVGDPRCRRYDGVYRRAGSLGLMRPTSWPAGSETIAYRAPQNASYGSCRPTAPAPTSSA